MPGPSGRSNSSRHRSLKKGSTAYLKTLTNEQRQSYDDQKAAYLKGLKDDPAGTKKEYAFYVLDPRKHLALWGTGHCSQEVSIENAGCAVPLPKERGHLSEWQCQRSNIVCAVSNEMLLDKRIVTPGGFFYFAQFWNGSFSADGAWDYQNKGDNSVQASHIECNPKSRLCTESDAVLGFGTALAVTTKDYGVAKSDGDRILAELTNPPCERTKWRLSVMHRRSRFT